LLAHFRPDFLRSLFSPTENPYATEESFSFSADLTEKTDSAGLKERLLVLHDRGGLEDRQRLKTLLRNMEEALLQSRELFDRYLSSLPDEVIGEAWQTFESVVPSKAAEQLSLDFSAQSSEPDHSPFRAADRPGEYHVIRPVTVEELFSFTRERLEERFRRSDFLTSPQDTKRFLTLHLTEKEQEVFASVFLDNRHRVLAFEELFRGTIDGCSVHPREVVRRTIHHNAAALVFAHNHPSGVAEPSQADQMLTQRLKKALELIDARILDHIVIGGAEAVSFAERGIL
jgi:DNA repair protein RadC